MYRRLSGVLIMTAAQCLAVDADDLSFHHPEHPFYPAHKTLLKCLSVQCREYSTKRIVRRYPIRQLQKCSQPSFFHHPKRLNFYPAFRSSQSCTYCDNDDFDQLVVTAPFYTRVL